MAESDGDRERRQCENRNESHVRNARVDHLRDKVVPVSCRREAEDVVAAAAVAFEIKMEGEKKIEERIGRREGCYSYVANNVQIEQLNRSKCV